MHLVSLQLLISGVRRSLISAPREEARAEVEVKGIVTFLERDGLLQRAPRAVHTQSSQRGGLTHKLCPQPPPGEAVRRFRALPTHP